MAVWDDALTEQDRKVVELRPPRPLTGFGERSALLVVDMNRGAVGEDRPIAEQLDRYPGACGNFAWDAIRHMQRLIPAARGAGIPVIYSRHIFRATHDLPRAKDPSYSYSELSPLSELQPEVAPQPGDLLIETAAGQSLLSDGSHLHAAEQEGRHPADHRKHHQRMYLGNRHRRTRLRVQGRRHRGVRLRPYRDVPQGIALRPPVQVLRCHIGRPRLRAPGHGSSGSYRGYGERLTPWGVVYTIPPIHREGSGIASLYLSGS